MYASAWGWPRRAAGADVPPSITVGRTLAEAMAELDYLQFSTLLRLSADAQEGSLNFGLLAGPYLALNLSCNVAVTTHETQNTRPPVPPGIPNRVPSGRTRMAADTGVACGEDGVSEVTSSDFGLAFGAGFEVKLSDSLGLGFELIYAMGPLRNRRCGEQEPASDLPERARVRDRVRLLRRSRPARITLSIGIGRHRGAEAAGEAGQGHPYAARLPGLLEERRASQPGGSSLQRRQGSQRTTRGHDEEDLVLWVKDEIPDEFLPPRVQRRGGERLSGRHAVGPTPSEALDQAKAVARAA